MVSSGCRKRAARLTRRQALRILTPIAHSPWPMTRHVLPVPRCSHSRDCAQRHVGATMSSRWRFGANSAPLLNGMVACGRQRNDIEYPVTVAARLTPDDARSAVTVATELIDAAEQLLHHLGLFS